MALLDTVASVDGAFSLSRYLYAAFTGAVVRLREDNTSTEQDFKLNGSDILVTDDVSEDTVAAWLVANSASNAYIAIWYDQTGNHDFIQATAINQPLLEETGLDGKATARSQRLLATEMRNAFPHMVNANGCFVAVVHAQLANRATDYAIFSDANSSTWLVGNKASLGGYRHLADSGQEVVGAAMTLAQAYQVTFEFASGANPKNVSIRRDGAGDGSASLSVDSRAGAHRLFGAGSLQAPDANISELIYTNSVFSSTDRGLVESSQGTQYGIPIAGGDKDVAATTATLTLTPNAATITNDRNALAGTVALSLAPQAANITSNRNALAATVELVLTTYPASIAGQAALDELLGNVFITTDVSSDVCISVTEAANVCVTKEIKNEVCL